MNWPTNNPAEKEANEQMTSAPFWDIAQCWVVMLYRRLATNYQSHFHEEDFVSLEDGTDRFSIKNHHSTLSNIPQEHRSHLHRGGTLKSRIDKKFLVAMSSFFLRRVFAKYSSSHKTHIYSLDLVRAKWLQCKTSYPLSETLTSKCFRAYYTSLILLNRPFRPRSPAKISYAF
jgi:hypothetical protein